MDLSRVRAMSAADLVRALEQLEIPEHWVVYSDARAAAEREPGAPCLPEPKERQKLGFQNLIVGTIAERVFREDHLAALEPDGYSVVDYHEAGENRDYGLQKDGLELPINVKVASTLFRNAQTVVGLAPEDCVPISAYKALGASERVPGLVYVDLVDFTLREKVDAFMNALDGPLGIGWHLLSWYAGKGGRAAEDRYLNALFDKHAAALKVLAPPASQYRVISARRVLAILRHHPRRVPGLGVPGAGTGGFNAEVNVHVSVSTEMVAWADVADELRAHGIQHVLDRVAEEATETWPYPSL
jgi:hypothetical protein